MPDNLAIESWIQSVRGSTQPSLPKTALSQTYATPPRSISDSPEDGNDPANPTKLVVGEGVSKRKLVEAREHPEMNSDLEETPTRPAKLRRLRRHDSIHSSLSSQSHDSSSLFNADGHTQLIRPQRSQVDMQSYTSSTANRSPSPKKDIINDLRSAQPKVDWQLLRDIKYIPEKVITMLDELGSGYGEGEIPALLKPRLATCDPIGIRDIPERAYREAFEDQEEDALKLWNIVFSVSREAASCDQWQKDEQAWSQTVVLPLMQIATRPLIGEPMLRVDGIQTQAIHRDLLPRHIPSSGTYRKKADFAWFYSEHNEVVRRYYNSLSLGGQRMTLSHSTDTFNSRTLPFCGLEVKSARGDSSEALAQLSLWISAGLRKMKELYEKTHSDSPSLSSQLESQFGPAEARNSTLGNQPIAISATLEPVTHNRTSEPELLPLLGWTVHGHEWKLYAGWIKDFTTSDTQICGPLIKFNMDTLSYYGVFKLLDVLKRVNRYASTTYWSFIEAEILKPLIAQKDVTHAK